MTDILLVDSCDSKKDDAEAACESKKDSEKIVPQQKECVRNFRRSTVQIMDDKLAKLRDEHDKLRERAHKISKVIKIIENNYERYKNDENVKAISTEGELIYYKTPKCIRESNVRHYHRHEEKYRAAALRNYKKARDAGTIKKYPIEYKSILKAKY
jgi:hypothetical protein